MFHCLLPTDSSFQLELDTLQNRQSKEIARLMMTNPLVNTALVICTTLALSLEIGVVFGETTGIYVYLVFLAWAYSNTRGQAYLIWRAGAVGLGKVYGSNSGRS